MEKIFILLINCFTTNKSVFLVFQSCEESVLHPSFSISPAAARRLETLSQKEGHLVMLRIQVESGGCAGFQYQFHLEKTAKPDDLVFQEGGAQVITDPTSFDFLKGAQLDYVEDMMEASFTIQNPNSTASCGCGTSFSVF